MKKWIAALILCALVCCLLVFAFVQEHKKQEENTVQIALPAAVCPAEKNAR